MKTYEITIRQVTETKVYINANGHVEAKDIANLLVDNGEIVFGETDTNLISMPTYEPTQQKVWTGLAVN